MFAELTHKIGTLFITTEEYERDVYLASSVDFADLERRMHSVDTNTHAGRFYSSGASRDVSAF